MSYQLRLLGIVLACLFLVGCGGGYPKVTGVVTLDGQALDGATVQFIPDGSGQVATATTDSSGHFKMGTIKEGDGVVPGKYKVTITKTANAPAPTPYFGNVMAQKFANKQGKEAASSGKEGAAMLKQEVAQSRKRRAPTPPTYQDANKTPLRADVPAQLDYKFELQSDSK